MPVSLRLPSPPVLAGVLGLGLLLLSTCGQPLHAQQRTVPDSVRAALEARDLTPAQARRQARLLACSEASLIE